MSDLLVREFDSRAALDQQLASEVAAILTNAVDARGKASLVVSGGSTPLNFFQLLSQQDLPWQYVTITLADERWVEADHADSNQRLVQEKLLLNKAAAASFVALKNSAVNAEAGVEQCERDLAPLGKFDLVILGMGGDGHTASLFPCSQELPQGLDMKSGRTCVAVQPTTAPHQRMSMTLPRLLDAAEIVVHIAGADKKAVLERALRVKDQAQLPISAVLQQQRTPVSVFWAE
ncbi:MAG: 6-phosphogluconolactonase [Gammaproteobacteria bacterium]|uniref:6-phosphogluconolactonase n=1 Tax=Pseudomaricurvus alcaniphilus TaxID=1166482 RepID=UPI00140C0CD7|nr:6-phosphogluconolactonase [Pseudomaricurvus alcaniphilus]MBR9912247.1 6-phosphogluconolactonase [Gammaproteobacteria bacterium]NHN37376.1 6-phosphogluconolactonase [Pseudomaricurvus alcaniphilus]